MVSRLLCLSEHANQKSLTLMGAALQIQKLTYNHHKPFLGTGMVVEKWE